MNTPNLPPSDQFVLRTKSFDDLEQNKYYAVKIGASEPYVAQIIGKEGDNVTVHFMEDDYQQTIDRCQTDGTCVPTYEFLAPVPRGGRRRRTRSTRRRRTTRRRRA